MKKLKQNSSLTFVSIMLAVFALFAVVNLDSFASSYEVAYDSVELSEATSEQNSVQSKSYSYLDNHSPVAAFLETRKPNRQVHFRPLRGSTTQGFFSRTASILERLNSQSANSLLAFSGKLSGYPSPAFFCAAKDYYVYTLKRILC